MRDRLGGYIAQPDYPGATNSENLQLSGMWTLREAEALTRRGEWSFNIAQFAPKLWLDASNAAAVFDATSGGNLVTADGGAIARLEDQSDTQQHFTQLDQATRPVLNVSGQNGLNVIAFAGANNFLTASVPPNPTFFTSTFTIISVARATTAALSAGSYFYNNTALYSVSYGMNLGFTSNNFAIAGVYAPTDRTVSLSYPLGTWAVFITEFVQSQRFSFGINNANLTSSTSQPGVLDQTTTSGQALVLGRNTYLAGRNFVGQFGELLVFDKLLTANQLTILVAFLTRKWGIT